MTKVYPKLRKVDKPQVQESQLSTRKIKISINPNSNTQKCSQRQKKKKMDTMKDKNVNKLLRNRQA